MSKKTKVVLFEEGKVPRIFTNPSNVDIEKLKELGKVVINPKIPSGVPPHRWEIAGRNIQEGNDLIEIGRVILPNTPQEIFIPEADYADLEDIEMLLGKYLELGSVKADKVIVAQELEKIDERLSEMQVFVVDKLNRTCIIGALMALFLLLLSFREEIQQIILRIR